MIKSLDGGINCGSDCEEKYASGTWVTLTATPVKGLRFAYWDDGTSRSFDNPVTITIDGSKTLTAVFSGLLTTSWDQAEPYKICYDSNKDRTKEEYVVGCTAVAVGQLINYYLTHGHSNGWLDVMLQGVIVYPRFNGKLSRPPMTINNGAGYETLNSGYINSINEPIQTNYCEDQDNNSSTDAINLRTFLFDVACGLDTDFQKGAVGPYLTEVYRFLIQDDKLAKLLVDRFRFQNGIKIKDVRTLDKERVYIKESIDQGHPVLITMSGVDHYNPVWTKGHTALIDGYRELPNGSFEVLINWGWGNRIDILGNRLHTNEAFYSTNGSINVGHFTWNNFNVFENTRPLQ